ncbi:hypothetical protein HZH68_003410 [Vespula germanica]|uniref:Uncharacterized protein n=1 Tax=Vespula germanica TaxID=30212 RepID=A0A834NP04_VESGE|nr:hypothetical protein HZH68_003410 [Vespula germanica]
MMRFQMRAYGVPVGMLSRVIHVAVATASRAAEEAAPVAAVGEMQTHLKPLTFSIDSLATSPYSSSHPFLALHFLRSLLVTVTNKVGPLFNGHQSLPNFGNESDNTGDRTPSPK